MKLFFKLLHNYTVRRPTAQQTKHPTKLMHHNRLFHF